MLFVMRRLFLIVGVFAVVFFPFANGFAQDEEPDRDEILEHASEPWTGDLKGMTERGFIRILTVHNPLFFQFDGAGQRGLVSEWGKAFEDHMAEEIGRVRSPTVVLIPVSRDELLPGLIEGRGDLVMGNLTITPEREKLVDFALPIHSNVNELVITGPAHPEIATFDDLVHTGLYVRRSSSYFEHLQRFNSERIAAGKPPIPITEADENLEDYDLLDMVNAGVVGAIIVDSHKATFWQQVFDKIQIHEDLSVNSGGQIAWALRKNSPQLMKLVASFSQKVKKGSLLGNILLKRYLGDADWLDNALADEDRERYEETIEIIKRYAHQYDFDWLIIAAQAYQESRFDQNKRSRAGAVGVMQLLPSTAEDPIIGIPDIATLENNIHAGVKYLHWLRVTYYSDDAISPLDRVLFSFAAYNAGPGNMKKARRRAKRLGFDTNEWFGNVEIGMYRAVSGEPAAYVRNIYKYYVTYQGLERSRRAREHARELQFENQVDSTDAATRIWALSGITILLLGALVFWFRHRPRSG